MQTQTTVDTRALSVLEALARAPDLSQRELAVQAGLSLTRAHFVLRELIEGGLVKLRSTGASTHRLGYSYELTTEGRALYTRLSYQVLSHTVLQFRDLLRHCRSTLGELVDAGVREVALLGEGPLRDAVREILEGQLALREVSLERARVVVVCDPEAETAYQGQAQLVRLAAGMP
ncbi:MAG: winged helix-turn-helix transcriptional regulator [Pseudomonadota bacterium]